MLCYFPNHNPKQVNPQVMLKNSVVNVTMVSIVKAQLDNHCQKPKN